MALLYYYTNPENADRIIKDRVLTGSPVNNTNDRLEGIGGTLITGLLENSQVKGIEKGTYEDYHKLNASPNNRYLCLSKNSPKGIMAPAMWRRYGAQYKGKCFVVDFKTPLYKFMTHMKAIHHGRIIYTHVNHIIEGTLTGSISLSHRSSSPLGIKDVSWVTEREYRFLWHPENNSLGEHPELPRDIINYTIIGAYLYCNEGIMRYLALEPPESSEPEYIEPNIAVNALNEHITFSDDAEFVDPPT